MQQVSDLQTLEGWELRAIITELAKDRSKPLEVYHAEIQVLIDEMNRRGRVIAKKHKKRHYDFQMEDWCQRKVEH